MGTMRLTWMLGFIASLAGAQVPSDARSALFAGMDRRAPEYQALARKIWQLAETGFQEKESAALLRAHLAAHGFTIRDRIGGLETAFIAEWGAGKPVVAILGEYDALPGLSQQAVPERRPRVEGGPGHGCGHNLFGTAAAFAAVMAKEHLEKNRLPGTVRFYGTPAEEGGGGKIYMLRAGAFQDVDAALTWHPLDRNEADNEGWLANISARFRYRGKASHAAAAPDAGRSALDGLEITTHALNLLREHVPQETRLHYIVVRGGSAANIVPDDAELSLIVRHPDRTVLEGIWTRAVACANAGALGAGVQVEVDITSSYSNILTNSALVAVLDRGLREAGGVVYTSEEQAFAEKLRATLEGSLPPLDMAARVNPVRTALMTASTDVGDVSWVAPTAQFFAATFPPGVPLHSWQSTAAAGSTLGEKGMLVAARTLALSAIDLFLHPETVQAARTAFDRARAGREYRSLLPAGALPRGH